MELKITSVVPVFPTTEKHPEVGINTSTLGFPLFLHAASVI